MQPVNTRQQFTRNSTMTLCLNRCKKNSFYQHRLLRTFFNRQKNRVVVSWCGGLLEEAEGEVISSST